MYVKLAGAGILVAAHAVSASNNAIGSAGTYAIDTPGFSLELDVANQVATRLVANPGPNAGGSPFNFLLPTSGRTDDGYYVRDPTAINQCILQSC